MLISWRRMAEALISVFTTLLFVLFILFDTYYWGKLAFFGLSFAIFLLGAAINYGKVKIRVNAYVILNVLFILYVLSTSFWAINPSDTVLMARTLARTFLCAYAVYLTYLNFDDITRVLKCVMWAGYIVAIYALLFYGVDAMILSAKETASRLENEFSNINSIGMACAVSCMIQLNQYNSKNKRFAIFEFLFMIPAITVIAATQSRKALVFIIAGILSTAVVKVQNSEDSARNKFAKIIIGIVIGASIIYMLLQLDIFAGISERMQRFINTITGEGKADHSTVVRENMIKMGWEWFLKYPLGGIGMANPHILSAKYLNFDAYLHNNYIELLCGGGIPAAVLYYALYVYLFSQLIKYRNADKKQAVFFMFWLTLMLLMNFAMVSYYSKIQNFYLMIHFVNVFYLKRKAMSDGHKEICT